VILLDWRFCVAKGDRDHIPRVKNRRIAATSAAEPDFIDRSGGVVLDV
jgi:hypothetical protein